MGAPAGASRRRCRHPALDPVLRKALAKDKDERYATLRGADRGGRAALGSRAQRAAPARPRAGAAGVGRRSRSLLVAAGGAVAAVARRRRRGRACRAAATASRRIDRGGAQVSAFIAAATAPSNIAVGEGAVWVLTPRTRPCHAHRPARRSAVTGRFEATRRADRHRRRRGGRLGRQRRRAGRATRRSASRGSTRRRRRSRTRSSCPNPAGGEPSLNWGFPTDRGRRRRRVGDRPRRHASRASTRDRAAWWRRSTSSRRDRSPPAPRACGSSGAPASPRIDPATNRVARRISLGSGARRRSPSAAAAVGDGEHEGRAVADRSRAGPGRRGRSTSASASPTSPTAPARSGPPTTSTGRCRAIDPRTQRGDREDRRSAPSRRSRPAPARRGSAPRAPPRRARCPTSVRRARCRAAATPDVLIASDLPLQGPAAPARARWRTRSASSCSSTTTAPARFSVGYRSCDDSTAQTGNWENRRCAANANAYAARGAARRDDRPVQLVLRRRSRSRSSTGRRAARCAMISPSNTDAGLTRPRCRRRGRLPRRAGRLLPDRRAQLHPRGRRTTTSGRRRLRVLARQLGLGGSTCSTTASYWQGMLARPVPARGAAKLGVRDRRVGDVRPAAPKSYARARGRGRPLGRGRRRASAATRSTAATGS